MESAVTSPTPQNATGKTGTKQRPLLDYASLHTGYNPEIHTGQGGRVCGQLRKQAV
jgi:hypothetical protein